MTFQNPHEILNNGHVNFVMTKSNHGMYCLEVFGDLVTVELWCFIHRMVKDNHMDSERYKVTKQAGAFFQGGNDSPHNKWILVEFWQGSERAKDFIDYLNRKYIHDFDAAMHHAKTEEEKEQIRHSKQDMDMLRSVYAV